jgi:hypothetical protein
MANLFSDITNWLSGGNTNAGLDAYKQAAGIIGSTETPDLSTLIPRLQMQVQQGTLTPAEAQAALQEASAYSNIQTNPQLMADAMQALEQQKQVATQGGMTDIDKAQLAAIQADLNNKNAAQQQAIQTDMAQKGLANSGSAMAQRMLASQGNSNAAALSGAQVAANAQQRALQAMQNYGQQAQNIQQQQFNQQAQAAQAQNAINQFNAANRQQTALQNAANRQQANLGNFQMANQIAGKNTDTANQQAMMPYQAAQQNFQNQLQRNTATGNALTAQGQAQVAQGNKQAGTSSGWIDTAVKLAPSIISWFSDENLKEDIRPADNDIESMMDNLVGKRFRYKGDSAEHISPMAQDLEKSPLTASAVHDTAAGKVVVPDAQMQAAVLAALGNLHQRVSNMESK